MKSESLFSRVRRFRGSDTSSMSTEKLLSTVGLFHSLDQKQLAQVAQRMETRQYERDQVIVEEGAQGDALHIVTSGLLEVRKERRGREPIVIGTLEPGQTFCEMALIEDYPRVASIVAAEPSTCLALAKEQFQGVLAEHPAIAVAMVFEVSRRLRDTLDLLDANGQ